MKSLLASFLLISLVFASCSTSYSDASPSTDITLAEETESSSPTEKTIVGTYWKMIRFEGQPVKMAENQQEEIHFILTAEDARISGFSGCNSFFGSYTTQEGRRIKFDQLGSTKRACPDISVNEQDVLEVFGLADNYILNGNTISLNVGSRREPLAVFEAVANREFTKR